uniref:Uncharacterized protein n=1 Tax=Jahnella sp. MSr9139 TaxID=1434086 RepID=A0A4Y5T0W4_9BACT|nr:hypothetical protein [Jahnella sp. MSr9139]
MTPAINPVSPAPLNGAIHDRAAVEEAAGPPSQIHFIPGARDAGDITPSGRLLEAPPASARLGPGGWFWVPFVQLLLAALGLLASFTVAMRAMAEAREAWKATAAEALITGAYACFICALPTFVMICLSVLAARSRNARLSLGMRASFHRRWHHGDPLAQVSPSILDDAELAWRHEAAQVEHTTARLQRHAFFYGTSASFMLSCTALIVLDPIFRFALDVELQPPHVWGALAVGSAVAVTFTREIGRILVREAGRDSSTPMMAWATRRLVLVVTGTILLVCLVLATGYLKGAVSGSPGWILLGALMAVVGERAVAAVDERAARLLGVQQLKRKELDDVRQIEGLSEEDARRLAEEGIDSVHALALFSTPRLFFNTPYTLNRICDWQDQALLVVRLGEKARLFREQLLVRGAIDAQRVAEELLALPPGDEQLEQMMRALDLGPEPQGRMTLRRIVDDQVITELLVYRHACCDGSARR